MAPKTAPKGYQKSLKMEVAKKERKIFENGAQKGPKSHQKWYRKRYLENVEIF